MKVAKFWARESGEVEDPTGYRYLLISWSGSNTGLAEAKRKALEKLSHWTSQLQQGKPIGDYPYEDKDDIREELIHEQNDDNGNLIAAITRNRYGALVLNAANMLIADVDLPPVAKQGLFKRIFSAFANRDGQKSPANQNRDNCRRRFHDFQREHPDLTLRIYETFAGFRLIVVNKTFDPLDKNTVKLLEELDSDKLYIRLCKSQACFRARLTPKPWRCDFKAPPNLYPRQDANEKRRFTEWQNDYEAASAGYAVCRFVGELGNGKADEAIRQILQLHDSYVLKQSVRALA